VPFEPSRSTKNVMNRLENAPAVDFDLIVIGAGAAGLATAIFAKRAMPAMRVTCLDGARIIGAKILVSGGSRCNVTNRLVTERDFWGGAPRVVRAVLRAFPAPHAVAFFTELGVSLHEEDDGKLFPDTNRSRTVLDALLGEADRRGIVVATSQRVASVSVETNGFVVATSAGGAFRSRIVVLATGGQSLPKTGSDGYGYELAARFGHRHVQTTPALAPLIVEGERPPAGVTHAAAMTLRGGGKPIHLAGSMVWTHFGVSGPLPLNMSRHWHRARIEGGEPSITLNVLPGATFESAEAWLLEQERARPRALVTTVLATRVPAAIADVWTRRTGIDADTTMAHLSRERRRQLIHELVASPLSVLDSRGYSYAEATAGGVPLDEVDPATLQSRLCRGLYFAGEILDVDGRLGGFNFQWAWSSGYVAGGAIARALTSEGGSASRNPPHNTVKEELTRRDAG
jgi:predicted Rossmann fold flavoprotein